MKIIHKMGRTFLQRVARNSQKSCRLTLEKAGGEKLDDRLVIFCGAGLGRTGEVISALLLSAICLHAIKKEEDISNIVKGFCEVSIRLDSLFKCSSLVKLVMDIDSVSMSDGELVAFLMRSGRTNELSWSDDSSYGLRSAHIFKHIATKLGFNIANIKMIADMFDHTIRPNTKTQNLIQVICAVAHEADLIRCFDRSSLSAVQNWFARIIQGAPEQEHLAKIFYSYANELCKLTGSIVVAEDLIGQKSGGIKRRRDLAFGCVHYLNEFLAKLVEFTPHSANYSDTLMATSIIALKLRNTPEPRLYSNKSPGF